jgi:uncharacterized protein YfaT (DUF1175 family)
VRTRLHRNGKIKRWPHRKYAQFAAFIAHAATKSGKNRVFQRNARENRKKPVETQVLPLTNAVESRTVKGGRLFRSRVNTGFCAG